MSVPDYIVGEGIIGSTVISVGLYAVFHKETPMPECFKTWNYIYEVWFEENGYHPDSVIAGSLKTELFDSLELN